MEDSILQQILDMLSFGQIFAAASVLFVTWLTLTLMQRGLSGLSERFPRYRLTLNRVYPIARILIWALITGFVVIGIFAPPESIVFALLGSVGLAVGLASQDAIRNMVAGSIIMFNPPYRVGDMVTLAGHYGEVIKLEWSVTWLRTFDDNTVMVPNAEVLNGAVANSNSGALDEMIAVHLDIPAHSDHQLASELAYEATCCSPFVFLKKPVNVLLASRFEHGHYLVRVTIKAYVLDVRLERRFATDITGRVLQAYKEAGIFAAPAAHGQEPVQPETSLPRASNIAN